MKKKLIIFDMDGTLVNSSLTIANAINYVRKNLGFEAMEQEYILKRVKTMNDGFQNIIQNITKKNSFYMMVFKNF